MEACEAMHCPKCNSGELIPKVRILDQRERGAFADDLQVEVQEAPGALLFKGNHHGKLRATICGACGFTELYATNPKELLLAHKKAVASLK